MDATGFPGWADDAPIMFGSTENEARYFIKPKGPQLPFPRNIVIALLNLVKPGGIYTWTIVEKIATALCGAHARQVLDILRQSGKAPYECLDWLMTSMSWKEPEYQTTERSVVLNRRFYRYNFTRVSPRARITRNLARHTSEIRYVFGNLAPVGDYDETDRVIADAMQSAWTTFARTGVPQSPDGMAWPAFDAHAPQYMSIEDGLLPRPYAASELTRAIASMRGPPAPVPLS